MITREEARLMAMELDRDDGNHRGKYVNVEELVTEIYNDHEAQLKAKESNLERQDMIIKCLNIDLDNKEKLLKAKDEEIKELGEIVQQYLIPSKNYDAILKAKDDEIVALKAECEYDQRNAARSQRESVSLLDKLKAKDDEIRRLNNLYADTIKDLGDAIIEIERLKEHITHLQNVYMKLDGKYLKLKTELEELKDDK